MTHLTGTEKRNSPINHHAPTSSKDQPIPLSNIIFYISLLSNNHHPAANKWWTQYVYLSTELEEGFVCMAHIYVDDSCLQSVGPDASYFCTDHQMIYETQAITHHHFQHNPHHFPQSPPPSGHHNPPSHQWEGDYRNHRPQNQSPTDNTFPNPHFRSSPRGSNARGFLLRYDAITKNGM